LCVYRGGRIGKKVCGEKSMPSIRPEKKEAALKVFVNKVLFFCPGSAWVPRRGADPQKKKRMIIGEREKASVLTERTNILGRGKKGGNQTLSERE